MTKPVLHPSELQFLLPESKTNTGALFGGASVSWSMIVLMLALLMWLRPNSSIRDALPSINPVDLVSFPELRLGDGGGGGGGNRSLEPPRTAPLPKVAAIEPDPVPVATVDPLPEPQPLIAAQVQPLTQSNTIALLGPSSNTDSLSRGPGNGPRAGPGDGPGSGPDKGPGSGPGDEGPGGRPVLPGPGITNPALIASAKPSYTSEAMIRRIQGVAVLQCVVTRNGTVDDCTVVESLDRVFGLDEQAIKAAKAFRFTPGRRQGEPVPVLVRIEIVFSMR